MIKNGFLSVLVIGTMTACGSGGGGGGSGGTGGGGSGGGGSYISNPPSMSTIPTSSINNSSGAGAKGTGTCGFAGRYGYCTSAGLADTPSVRIYATVEQNCADVYLQVKYYTGANCSGSEYYTRTDHYTNSNTNGTGHVSISGGQNLDLTFLDRTEQYTATGLAGTNKASYKSCPWRNINQYTADTDLVSNAVDCGGVSSITDYNAIKVNASGMFLGDQSACTSYFGSTMSACTTSGARPTALQSTGIPFWN